MGTDKHAQERVKSGHTTPPAGRNDMTDGDHALRAGKDATQRKSATRHEPSTRDEGSDDRRSGSESGKS
jgi:hypothetical protein